MLDNGFGWSDSGSSKLRINSWVNRHIATNMVELEAVRALHLVTKVIKIVVTIREILRFRLTEIVTIVCSYARAWSDSFIIRGLWCRLSDRFPEWLSLRPDKSLFVGKRMLGEDSVSLELEFREEQSLTSIDESITRSGHLRRKGKLLAVEDQGISFVIELVLSV